MHVQYKKHTLAYISILDARISNEIRESFDTSNTYYIRIFCKRETNKRRNIYFTHTHTYMYIDSLIYFSLHLMHNSESKDEIRKRISSFSLMKIGAVNAKM